MRRIFVLPWLVLLLAGAPRFLFAQSSERPDEIRVAIAPFRNNGKEQVAHFEKGGHNMLTTALDDAAAARGLELQFVERQAIDAVLEEIGISSTYGDDLTDQQTIEELEMKGARYLVVPYYMKPPNSQKIRVDVRVINLKTGVSSINEGAVIDVEDADPFPGLARQLVHEMCKELGISVAQRTLHLLILPFEFKYVGPKEQLGDGNLVLTCLKQLLGESPLEQIKLVSHDDIPNERSLEELGEAFPHVDLFLKGTISFDGRVMLWATLHRKSDGRGYEDLASKVVFCQHQTRVNVVSVDAGWDECHPSELYNLKKGPLKQLAMELQISLNEASRAEGGI